MHYCGKDIIAKLHVFERQELWRKHTSRAGPSTLDNERRNLLETGRKKWKLLFQEMVLMIDGCANVSHKSLQRTQGKQGSFWELLKGQTHKIVIDVATKFLHPGEAINFWNILCFLFFKTECESRQPWASLKPVWTVLILVRIQDFGERVRAPQVVSFTLRALCPIVHPKTSQCHGIRLGKQQKKDSWGGLERPLDASIHICDSRGRLENMLWEKWFLVWTEGNSQFLYQT